MIDMEIRRLGELDYPVANAMNTLCTNLSFASGVKKIMITSCLPQEGKSYIAMNLMRAMATNLGAHVVLVDADIRASALRGTYSIKINSEDTYLGLTGYLSGRCEKEDIIGRTNIPSADLILSGKTVMNSLPLFNSDRMKLLLDGLAAEYDVAIVDAPPVGIIIDAASIATLCDGTVFVVSSGEISAHKLKDAVLQIEKAGCPIIGYALNKFPLKGKDNDYYYGNYYTKGARKRRGFLNRIK